MRIWDIHPGYLNRQSLLAEHRELHGLVSILVNRKKGYSQHPETLRWVGYGWALTQRHRLLTCEMALRGYFDHSPVRTRSNYGFWPSRFIDQPQVQFEILKNKYESRQPGRISLPNNAQELWSHHKYSVLARDQKQYKKIGRVVADRKVDFAQLALQLVTILRFPPSEGGIRNALQHMWGYVSQVQGSNHYAVHDGSLKKLMQAVQTNARNHNEPYLIKSTSLSELMAWL